MLHIKRGVDTFWYRIYGETILYFYEMLKKIVNCLLQPVVIVGRGMHREILFGR